MCSTWSVGGWVWGMGKEQGCVHTHGSPPKLELQPCSFPDQRHTTEAFLLSVGRGVRPHTCLTHFCSRDSRHQKHKEKPLTLHYLWAGVPVPELEGRAGSMRWLFSLTGLLVVMVITPWLTVAAANDSSEASKCECLCVCMHVCASVCSTVPCA